MAWKAEWGTWRSGERYPENAKGVALLDGLLRRKRVPKKRRYAKGSRRAPSRVALAGRFAGHNGVGSALSRVHKRHRGRRRGPQEHVRRRRRSRRHKADRGLKELPCPLTPVLRAFLGRLGNAGVGSGTLAADLLFREHGVTSVGLGIDFARTLTYADVAAANGQYTIYPSFHTTSPTRPPTLVGPSIAPLGVAGTPCPVPRSLLRNSPACPTMGYPPLCVA